MKRLSELRDEKAIKRSLRQCTSGNQDLDKAISFYLRVGYEDGWNDCQAEMMEVIEELREALELRFKLPLIYSDTTVETFLSSINELWKKQDEALAKLRELEGEE